jgi:hypothetical protein
MFVMELWIEARTFLRLCTAFAQPLLQKFFEVSVGIIVALAVGALWPEQRRLSSNSTAE